MDLMIEAKDKEQAIFSLRRKWGIEGGVPDEWVLRGEKMDDVREVPTEMGVRVFYEEGEEWRFKGPILMPARVKKVLEKLDREIGKVGEGEKRERGRLEGEKQRVLLEWEREKRVKWGLEKKVDTVDGNATVAKVQPKKMATAISGVTGQGHKEWAPETEVDLKANSKRKQKTVGSSVGDAGHTTRLDKPTAKGNVKLLAKSNGGNSLARMVSLETATPVQTRKVEARMQN
jgi:hypothetical protein